MSALQTATKRFIAICRDQGNDTMKQAAVEYARAVELYVSGLEMDMLHQHYRITELKRDIDLHVGVMRSYGIDTERLARRSIYTILGDITLADEYGLMRVPEKIANHVKTHNHD